jgi:hypothetical protein
VLLLRRALRLLQRRRRRRHRLPLRRRPPPRAARRRRHLLVPHAPAQRQLRAQLPVLPGKGVVAPQDVDHQRQLRAQRGDGLIAPLHTRTSRGRSEWVGDE